jgi:hypothetical protein
MTFLHFHRATNINAITFNAITVGAVVICGAMVSLPPAMAVPIGGVVPYAATNGVSGPRRPGPITTTNNTTSSSSSSSIITSSAPKVAKGRPMIIPTASEVRAD